MAGEKIRNKSIVTSSPSLVDRNKSFKHIVSPKPFTFSLREGRAGEVALFLVKVVALETIRRLSRARCPFLWRAVQALPVLGYLPFRWFQRWAPLRLMFQGVQKISRPVLFLSITTTFSDLSENLHTPPDNSDNSQPNPESPSTSSTSDTRDYDETPGTIVSVVSENWKLNLLEELKKQGITLPERINEDELCRFYTASNGNFLNLLSSVKRTIRWRERYYILQLQELEMWSHLVFWHGLDVMLRPCLIIRLGLACSSLMPHDRPRFVQAIVSQIEHGVLHLINDKDPHITVLMDCEGLSPFKFPMQVLRSCSTLVQDHYPNRLGTLFVIRLPPLVRVIAQTFIQVLKPTTRQKLRVEGEAYHKALSELLESVPAFLGGECGCPKCRLPIAETSRREEENHEDDNWDEVLSPQPLAVVGGCDHVLRTVVLAMLVLWIFIAFLAGFHDPDFRSSQP